MAAQVDYLADNFSEDCEHGPNSLMYGVEDSSSLNCSFMLAKLKDATDRVKISRVGEDKISAALFKVLHDPSPQLLLQLFNDIWLSDVIPSSWTSVLVLPILAW